MLIATGLRREARLLEGPGLAVVAGGGDSAGLEQALEEQVSAATAILSCGLAGALAPDLRAGDVVIGTSCIGVPATEPALAERLMRLLPAARSGMVAANDRPVADRGAKRGLRARSGALAVDMESHVAARVAVRHGLPFAALRVISDEAEHGLPPAALVGMRPDGGIALGRVLASLLRRPGQLPALVRTARHAGRAFRVLGGLQPCLTALRRTD